MAGILYGVGVGPGDPELITVKAVKKIRECDMIGIPAREAAGCVAYGIAAEAVPELKQKPVLAVPVPMAKEKMLLAAAYDAGCEKIAEILKRGKNIAFLNLGDPTIYGTYMELHKRVAAAGFRAEVINGVPSFCAVAGKLGLSLASRDEQLHILPGAYQHGIEKTLSGTRVLMKSAGRTAEVKRELCKLEEKEGLQICAVTNCGMEQEMVCHDIRELDGQAGYFTTIIVKDRE